MAEKTRDRISPARYDKGEARGIVIADSYPNRSGAADTPRIAAFIWGGKVRPQPTLPFGRWKGVA